MLLDLYARETTKEMVGYTSSEIGRNIHTHAQSSNVNLILITTKVQIIVGLDTFVKTLRNVKSM